MIAKNRVWLGVSVLVAMCVLCCGGGGFLLFRSVVSATKVKDEALSYGDASIRAICLAWDPVELEQRSSRNLKHLANHAQVKAAMANPLKRYGPLKRLISSSVRHISTSSRSGGMQATTVVTWTHCEFAKGLGRIQLNLRKVNGQWSIDALHVSPE